MTTPAAAYLAALPETIAAALVDLVRSAEAATEADRLSAAEWLQVSSATIHDIATTGEQATIAGILARTGLVLTAVENDQRDREVI